MWIADELINSASSLVERAVNHIHEGIIFHSALNDNLSFPCSANSIMVFPFSPDDSHFGVEEGFVQLTLGLEEL